MPKITYEKVTRNKDSSFSVIDYYNPYSYILNMN